MRGQGGVLDAILFALISVSASVIMIYTASVFLSGTDNLMLSMYSYQIAKNAWISLMYSNDGDKCSIEQGFVFVKIRKLLAGESVDGVGSIPEYFDGPGKGIWERIYESIPANYSLCFEKGSSRICYPNDGFKDATMVYSYETTILDAKGNKWNVYSIVYYE